MFDERRQAFSENPAVS